jgi:hypothetical protein
LLVKDHNPKTQNDLHGENGYSICLIRVGKVYGILVHCDSLDDLTIPKFFCRL